MKYVNVGTPDYELYVPNDRFPVIVGISDTTLNEESQPATIHSALYYPEKTFTTTLRPKEVIKRLLGEENEVPGLNYG